MKHNIKLNFFNFLRNFSESFEGQEQKEISTSSVVSNVTHYRGFVSDKNSHQGKISANKEVQIHGNFINVENKM